MSSSVSFGTPSGAAPRPARGPTSQVKRPAGQSSKEVDFTEAAVQARERAKRVKPAVARVSLQQVRRSLPVFDYRETLLNAARGNKNLIVVGETGSGKTTQIPQYLYESGFAKTGMIAVTQPRRVAAITVAQRVAEEMGVELGGLVGYTIRFDDVSSAETKIKYLTDGMLLREIQVDPRLSRYSVVMLDEAHERTLNTDILFALLKRLQATQRPDLRVIAMSATLDAAKFSTYFYDAPVALVPGRTHKVDVNYTEEPVSDVVEACVTTAMGIHLDKPLGGDVLCFMAGSDDIDTAKQVLEDRAKLLPAGAPGLVVVPMYSTLSPEQQLKAFEPTPPGARKVVFATNIAETSITLSGIKYVIDTGVAKVKQFVPSTSVEWLSAHPISKAEAFQRSGRSGRESEGECFRLMTEEAFLELPTSVVPEILRCSMASAVLALKFIGVDDVLHFDFIDKPDKKALKQAIVDLISLGALSAADMCITKLGRLMAEFPLEPHYSKVLIASADPTIAVDESGDAYIEHQQRVEQLKAAHEKKRNKKAAAAAAAASGAAGAKGKDLSAVTTAVGADDLDLPPVPTPFDACSFEMATLVAAISADQILVTVPKTKVALVAKAEAARRRFATPDGDLMMLLDILTQFGGLPEHRREQWCKENFVNFRNAKMALKVRTQLVEALQRHGLPIVSCIATANNRAARDSALPATVSAAGGASGLGHNETAGLFGAAFDRLAQTADVGVPLGSGVESSGNAKSTKAMGFTSPGSISSALASPAKPLDNLKKCLITGLYDKVAIRLSDGSYQTYADQQQVSIHPSSIVIQYLQQHRSAQQAKQASAHSREHAPIAAGDGARAPQPNNAQRGPGQFGTTAGHATRGGNNSNNSNTANGTSAASSSGGGSKGSESKGADEHPHACVIFHEIVMTSKKFIRDLMTIDPAWLTDVNPSQFASLRAHRTAGGAAPAPGEAGYDRDYDSSVSHTNTLLPGQRTAFASLTSKVLPTTTSLSTGKATHLAAQRNAAAAAAAAGASGAGAGAGASTLAKGGNPQQYGTPAKNNNNNKFGQQQSGKKGNNAKQQQTPVTVRSGVVVNPMLLSSGKHESSGW